MKLKLRRPSRWKEVKLEAMQRDFQACAQMHLDVIGELKITSATKLHHACYQTAKERFALPVVNVQRARDKAIEAYRSYRARVAKGKKAKPPTFQHVPLGVGQRALAITNGCLRLSTDKALNYLWLPIVQDPYHTPILDVLQGGKARHGASEIHKRGGEWYLHLTVYEDVPNTVENHTVFGLDLGVVNTAVLSGPSVVKFWRGREIQFRRNRFSNRRASLQAAGLMGEVKRSKGNEFRWMRAENHRISKQVLETVAEQGGALAIEKLLGIRDRVKLTRKVNRMLHSWAFGELIEMLHHKAPRYGVKIIEVDPRHTSQRCSKCGHTERGNRTRQADFKCKACNYEVNADVNASRNIARVGANMLGYTSSVTGCLTQPGEAPANREFGRGQACHVEGEAPSGELSQSAHATSQVPSGEPPP